MVLVWNVGEQPRSFVHSPASLPAFQWAIQTSESLDKGRLCPPPPPICGATPCPVPAPHLTLLSILSRLLCLALFTRGPSTQNSTAGPL